MYTRPETMSVNLHIEDYQEKTPFPFLIYLSARDIYTSVTSMLSWIGRFILVIIAIVFSPVWVTILYFLFVRSNSKARKAFEEMKHNWQDAKRSAEIFDRLEYVVRSKSIMELDGEFRKPKNFRMFRPFFIQIRKFYMIYDEQAKWLEQKVYPTAEELGIPLEDVEFMRSQMTAKDYEDLKDPDWFEFEKECIVEN